jgi:hypothetical protein
VGYHLGCHIELLVFGVVMKVVTWVRCHLHGGASLLLYGLPTGIVVTLCCHLDPSGIFHSVVSVLSSGVN